MIHRRWWYCGRLGEPSLPLTFIDEVGEGLRKPIVAGGVGVDGVGFEHGILQDSRETFFVDRDLEFIG